MHRGLIIRVKRLDDGQNHRMKAVTINDDVIVV